MLWCWIDFARKYEWRFGFAESHNELHNVFRDFAIIAHEIGIPLRQVNPDYYQLINSI